MALLIAILVFIALVTVIVGIWWARLPARRIGERLGGRVGDAEGFTAPLLRPEQVTRIGPLEWLARVLEQAGYAWTPEQAVLIIGVFGAVGGIVGAARVGGILWVLVGAVVMGSLPVGFLIYRGHKRITLFQSQFPDAMDMMTRAIRAGHALGGAIRLVGDEMDAPVGTEFQRVSEEIRLGVEPSVALGSLERRMPSDDVQFFCTAVGIQRTTGGNLAEVLDRLSEVIRERFKLLSHARALSAQHKWSAILVGVSPLGFAVMFQFLSPGYFGQFMASPMAPTMIALGLVSEIIGFLFIWRISNIKV